MASNCHTCDFRNEALTAWPPLPTQLNVCIVVLTFKVSISQTQSKSYAALNTLLNNIIDNKESISNPSTFTVWSPCLTDSRIAVVITTVRKACDAATSPMFDDIMEHLANPPDIQHIYLDLAVISLASSSSEDRIACDIVQLHGHNPGASIAIGRQFGWDPKRSSITSKFQSHTSAAFSRPGDLVREFRAWAEVSLPDSRSSSISTGSRTLNSPSLVSLSQDEDGRHYIINPHLDGDQHLGDRDRESLIMIFQWTSHVDGDRFKNSNEKSYGPNSGEVRRDLWDKEVALPIANLQGLGVGVDIYKLELRTVEPRLAYDGTVANQKDNRREKRQSKRLSIIASELGGRIIKLWK